MSKLMSTLIPCKHEISLTIAVFTEIKSLTFRTAEKHNRSCVSLDSDLPRVKYVLPIWDTGKTHPKTSWIVDASTKQNMVHAKTLSIQRNKKIYYLQGRNKFKPNYRNEIEIQSKDDCCWILFSVWQ